MISRQRTCGGKDLSQEWFRTMVQKKNLLKNHLTREALERLARVRLAHPNLAEQAEFVILQATQTGKIEQINEIQLKEILKELNSGKKQFRFIK